MNSKNMEIFQPQKQNLFSFIRMVCCYIIVYEHTVLLSKCQLPILNIRETAVTIFFVYSGFWILRSYLLTENGKQFLIKRIKRIVPMYYCVIFIPFIVGGILFRGKREYYFSISTVKYFFCNFCFLNFLYPSLPGNAINGNPINGSLWTLKIEIGFYILMCIIGKKLKKRKNRCK